MRRLFEHLALRLLPPAYLRKRIGGVAIASRQAQQIGHQSQGRQLLVDVSVIYSNDARTGIQRVVRSLLQQLLNRPPAGYSVRPVFASRKHGYRYAAPDFMTQPRSAAGQAGRAVQAGPGDIFLGLDLAAHLLPRHQAQLLAWKRNGASLHIVVYDLLPLQYPEWFTAKKLAHFRGWIKCVAVFADSAICISNSVKTELAALLGARYGFSASTLRITTITLGADIAASVPSLGLPDDAEFLLARLRLAPTVLMVGTLEPRKGHAQAVAAFDQLWQQGLAINLVIVGQPGWKTEALQQSLRAHPRHHNRLFWLEDASDELLQRLYALSQGVLVASRAEGFGLPLIEAALHNKPVLARDLPVFREIALPGVTYFSGEGAASLATAIPAWLQKARHEGGASQGQRQSPSLATWQTAAEQLLDSLGLSGKPCREADAGHAAMALVQGAAA